MNEARPPRVLIADDEDPIRTLLARMLRRAGFDPVQVADGQQAIEQLDAETFDVVILDLMMPRVDGFGVVQHLIATQPRMVDKTIVVTAFPKTAARERLHQLCCVLSKPFEMDELLQAVRECAER